MIYIRAKLLEKIEKLSIEEISVVLGWSKEQGLDQLPDNVVSLSMNPFFQAPDVWKNVVTSTGYFG